MLDQAVAPKGALEIWPLCLEQTTIFTQNSKKTIETSIVPKIRTVMEINVYVLFLSISSSTFLLKTVETSGGTKSRTGNMTLITVQDGGKITKS